MLKCSEKEIKFLESLEEARLATCHKEIPHVKPVSFIFHQDALWVATDYETRSFLNIKKNPNVAIVIDIYKSGDHRAVCFQGKVEVIENGEEFHRIYQFFYKKFKWVRDEPWQEEEAPFIKITPMNKKSWGIN